jgi:hypothetical protein
VLGFRVLSVCSIYAAGLLLHAVVAQLLAWRSRRGELSEVEG